MRQKYRILKLKIVLNNCKKIQNINISKVSEYLKKKIVKKYWKYLLLQLFWKKNCKNIFDYEKFYESIESNILQVIDIITTLINNF